MTINRHLGFLAIAVLIAITLALALAFDRDREPETFTGNPPQGSERPGAVPAPAEESSRGAIRVPFASILSPELAFGLAVTGRVVDGSGQPLSGVQVALRTAVDAGWLDEASHPEVPLDESLTPTDGRFALRGPQRSGYILALTHPRLPPLVLQLPPPLTPGGETALGDLAMRAGVGLIVEVFLREPSAPVAGARLTLSPVVFDPFLGAAAPRRVAVTGADGRGVIYGLPPGDWRVRVEADRLATVERDHHQARDLGMASQLQVVLDAGHSLGGRVLGPHGDPVQNALVTLVTEGAMPIATSLRTGVGGEFRALGLAAGKVRVRAESPAYEAVTDEVVLPRSERVELRFDPGLVLAGRVVDAVSGLPIAGVEIEARPADGHPLVRAGRIARATTHSGEAGSFRVEGLPTGRFVLFFTSERHAPRECEPLEALAEPALDTLFRLEPAPDVDVLVEDPSRAPVAGAEVVMLPADHQGTALSELLCRAAHAVGSRAYPTDSSGRARLPATRARFRLLARAPGFAARFGAVESAPPGIARFSAQPLTLERGVPLRGVAVDAAHRGVPAAVLRIEPVQPGSAMYEEVCADADGRFVFAALATGDWILTAPGPTAHSALPAIPIHLGPATGGDSHAVEPLTVEREVRVR